MRVVERRIYEANGGVQAVLLLHKRPYSTVIYGDDEYDIDGGRVLSGKELPDDEWEELRQQVHKDAEEWAR